MMNMFFSYLYLVVNFVVLLTGVETAVELLCFLFGHVTWLLSNYGRPAV